MLNNRISSISAALTTLVITLVLTVPAGAAPESDKQRDIERMLELSGATEAISNLVLPNIDGVVTKLRNRHPDLSKEAAQAVQQELKTIYNELMTVTMTAFTDMYDKNFTHKEIRQLISMYDSPVWRKQVNLQGKMYREMSQEMQKSGGPIIAAGLQRIKERCREYGVEF